MKIICETNIVKRSNREIKTRFQKSTLAIGRKNEKSNLCLILITNSNKSGTKYELTNNLSNMFRKFVDDGKCTISFKVPEVDLQIKADPIQLKAFLNVMKSELCPQSETKDVLKTDNKLIRAFGSSSKMISPAATKLVIKERSAFPAKGFPRTLTDLTISEINCSQMPIGVLNLTNLTSLDLSKNNITKIHKSLGNLKLATLNLSENDLGDSTTSWDFLNGENIKKSLKFLSISRNKLKFIPSHVFKCSAVVNLDLSCNEIFRVPFAIKMMKNLKFLNLSQNQISSLPYTFSKLYLDSIDLSSNNFPPQSSFSEAIRQSFLSSPPGENQASSLLELSARIVISKKIPFMTHNIPLILKEILFHSPLCSNSKCESMCLNVQILEKIQIIQPICKTISTSDNSKQFLADGPFCSKSCLVTTRDKLLKPFGFRL